MTNETSIKPGSTIRENTGFKHCIHTDKGLVLDMAQVACVNAKDARDAREASESEGCKSGFEKV